VTFTAGSFVGAPVVRIEDPALLGGRGNYIDNLQIPGVLTLTFVRSPIAHARIERIDVEAARSMPGVVGVYTAADLGLEPFAPVPLNPDFNRPPLAVDKVRFVGDAVVAVVATSKAAAADAAELVEIDYDPLDVVVDMEAALAPDAPLLFDHTESNIVAGMRAAAGADVLADADVVVRGRFENQRIAVVPMEGSAIAVIPGDVDDGLLPEGAEHDLTVYLGCQGPHAGAGAVAKTFDLDPKRVRVIAPNIGGSFGAKRFDVEGVVAVKLALMLDRPVRWVETRSENMLAMGHGRGQVQYVEMGFKRDGSITGMHCRIVGDAGAYVSIGAILPGLMTRIMAQGVYDIPRIAYDYAVVATNTTPMGAYRGAGRPEATAFLERIMNLAADELGIDPVQLRRQNLIDPFAASFVTKMGANYDSGDYELSLDTALEAADYDALRAEQAERRTRGDVRQLGIGLCVYVEITGGSGSVEEYADVELGPDGKVVAKVGTSAHGQGHLTAYSQIVGDKLMLPFDDIQIIQSDTALVAKGNGTGGSRSLFAGGSAVLRASATMLEQAERVAADLLEAAPEDVQLTADGTFAVAGVPSRSVSWQEIADHAAERGERIMASEHFIAGGATFPFGAHVAVVEVDTQTGQVTPYRHFAVDDCGPVVNPLLAAGQVHGGLASGISQALWEQYVYDEYGNPLTSTLAEYGIPSAAELITYDAIHTVTLSPHNDLGAKGIGESATIGSTPAVQNAVVDALRPLGVRHIELPCTPQRVWEAIEDARRGTVAETWRTPPAAFDDLPVDPR
jgi:carbon-monoxide dehydrogenase large subunit